MKRVPPSASPRIRGTVTLVALCFVSVMGITLAGYIAVCSRAMNLSNRTFHDNLSKQLAEAGVDEALRAFNKNNWADWSASGTAADWTVSGTTATCNLTFPAGKFGQGVTGSVKIRVDNYNAAQLNSTWSSSANYRTNDLVGYNGIWYRCVVSNSNQTPTSTTSNSSSTSTHWVEEQMPLQIPWSYPITYKVEAVAYYNGAWYRCILAHTSSAAILPTSTSYWTPISVITTNVSTSSSNNESLLNYWNGSSWAWWRYNSGWDSAPTVYWRWRGSSPTYAIDDVVNYNGIWYRCTTATNSTSNPAVNSSCWSSAPSNSMWAWNASSINYNLGDSVYYSSQWYRCILAHTSSGMVTPSSTTHWTNAPQFSTIWDSNKQYSQNDTVRYNGVWYRSLQNSNIAQNPATATTYWIGANTATVSYQWNATTAYSSGDYRCYGGVWYKCIAATTANAGHSPNNTTYWTATWANSAAVTTGAPVVYAEGLIAITGSPPVRTQVRATIAPAPLFPNALAATTTISANSGGIVDSYDSNTGTIAVQNGVANAPNLNYGTYDFHVNTAPNYSAVVAAGETSGTAITLSSTAVKGYVAAPSSSTSPFAPLISIGGSVKGFSSPASPNIDLTRMSRSPYIPQFDTLPLNPSGGGGGLAATWANVPKGTALPTTGTTVNIGTPGATTPSRYYYNGNYTVGTGTLNLLRINGPVILFINGDLFITDAGGGTTSRIEVASTGSAEIHVAGRFKADALGAGILNYTSDPKSLIIICDTTSTSTHFYSEGVNDLYGVIYIPYSTSTTGYFNDNNNTEIFGAVSANEITYSGANLNIHYDTSLRYSTFGGVDQPYTVTDWRELPATEQATMP